MTAQQQRELERSIEQSTREQVQRAVAQAQEAAARARASQLSQGQPVPPVPPVPPIPEGPVSGVIVTPQGERIVIGSTREPFATVAGKDGKQDVRFYLPGVPHELFLMTILFLFTILALGIGMPLARAYARRMDRQGGRAGPAPFPSDVSDRIERIEQAVEAIAIEVERVSEGQRFTTKLLAELRAPAALAESSPFTGDKR
jgi:hypothetical protein